MSREEQFKMYVRKNQRSLVAEDLFYTSSKHRFRGSLKLWLVESENAFFADHKEQETNYFVSKNRVVESKNPNNADQNQIHQNLQKGTKREGQSSQGNKKKQLILGPVKNSPLYLFYGNGLSYFFVSDVAVGEEEFKNQDESSLSVRPSQMRTQGSVKNEEQNSTLLGGDNISTFYKPTKAKKIGDKGLKIMHQGLQVKQIILGRVAEDYMIYMRKFSSSSLNKMKSYYKKTTKIFQRSSSKPIKAISNVLLLVESTDQTTLSKFLYFF